jgi:hypothetical protein
VGVGERRGRRIVEQVPGCLNGIEAPELYGALDRLALARSGHRQANGHAALTQARELLQHRAILQHAALKRGGMDLVEAQMLAQEPACFLKLALERGDRQVLALVHLGVDTPPGGVGVAPLGCAPAFRSLARSHEDRNASALP